MVQLDQPPLDLAELRERGVSPHSALVQRSVGVIALLCYTMVQPPELAGCARSVQSLLFSADVRDRCVAQPLSWVLGAALVVFVARFVAGWAQSGFATWSNRTLFRWDVDTTVTGPLALVGIPTLSIGIGAVMGTVMGSAVRELLLESRPYMELVAQYSQGFAVVAVVLLSILAIGGWFVARWRTMIRYDVGKGPKG